MENLKPEFFEMVLEEPLLLEKIAAETKIGPELIEELARKQDPILGLQKCAVIILEYYNETMPEQLKIKYSELFTTPACKATFKKEFVELNEA